MTTPSNLPVPVEVAPLPAISIGSMDKLVIDGNLQMLPQPERIKYYLQVCRHLGLDPVTRPFDYLTLNGKLVLYPRKDCTDQLRKIWGISSEVLEKGFSPDGKVYSVTVKVTARDGRSDSAIGAVSTEVWDKEEKSWSPATRNDLANIFMKAETKAKRRATLSICGLGMFDESEVETIKGVKPPSAITPAQIKELTDLLADDDLGRIVQKNMNAMKAKTVSDLSEDQAEMILYFIKVNES